jgi:hypothetical protein
LRYRKLTTYGQAFYAAGPSNAWTTEFSTSPLAQNHDLRPDEALCKPGRDDQSLEWKSSRRSENRERASRANLDQILVSKRRTRFAPQFRRHVAIVTAQYMSMRARVDVQMRVRPLERVSFLACTCSRIMPGRAVRSCLLRAGARAYLCASIPFAHRHNFVAPPKSTTLRSARYAKRALVWWRMTSTLHYTGEPGPRRSSRRSVRWGCAKRP